MKWTPEADAHLLLKIIEVCDVKPDYKRVSAAWDFGDDKPTVKAITERLGKLRKIAKGGNGANSGSSAPVTPQKKVNASKITSKTGTKSPVSQKRKRNPETPGNASVRKTSTSTPAELTLAELAADDSDSEDSDDSLPVKEELPQSKKAKTVAHELDSGENNAPVNSFDPTSFDPNFGGMGSFDGANEYPTPGNEAATNEAFDMW